MRRGPVSEWCLEGERHEFRHMLLFARDPLGWMFQNMYLFLNIIAFNIDVLLRIGHQLFYTLVEYVPLHLTKPLLHCLLHLLISHLRSGGVYDVDVPTLFYLCRSLMNAEVRFGSALSLVVVDGALPPPPRALLSCPCSTIILLGLKLAKTPARSHGEIKLFELLV
ncbi:hypothetical protein AAG570_002778 [Ranatra chinensis]|uniref:Uncharacterized protein n=1 Tax=Ranatra chinensis TaxID=642074 RepID=A0ABD0Y5A3_9HEMI